jgi:hypothetical protein
MIASQDTIKDRSEYARSERTKPRFDWATIVVTALVTGVITIATGMILYRWQRSEPHLVFSTIETIPFSGQNQVVGIYQVSISNDGTQAVEDVSCFIRVPGANIAQKRISISPSMTYVDSGTGDNVRLQVPGINPSENIQVSFLAEAASNLPARPEVSLRAKGVSGEEKSSKNQKTPDWLSIIPTVLGVLGASLALILFRARLVSKGRKGTYYYHDPDQRRVLSYLCRVNGLYDQASYYDSKVTEVAYWSEADRLAFEAVASNNVDNVRKVKSFLHDLLSYTAISQESRALIFYNLARLASTSNEMNENLAEAKKLAPKLIDLRSNIDPVSRAKPTGTDQKAT